MNDELLYFTTTKYRQVIRVLDKLKMPNRKIYQSYFNFVKKLLKKDFEIADKSFLIESNNTEKKHSKKYWVMWWQGLNEAPLIVQSNIKRMKKILNNDLVIISKNNFQKYTDISDNILNKFNQGKISFTSFSDIMRFNLLKNNGGIWIDSTVVISKRIKKENLLNKKFFSLCSEGKYQFVSDGRWTGWMIGGDSTLGLFHYVDTFYKEYFKRHSKIIDYYIVDYVIDHYYENNKSFQNIIKSQQKKWKNSEFMKALYKPKSEKLIYKFNNELTYSVQKITYKKKPNVNKNDSLYQAIINDDIDI
ncbi:MAG TPA: capsular polysaccharide synthesis protein [Candidatus Ligilactobacillus excrementigallinarum]|uniref:Capsular polysaccharide synthesis protein n=1 Tax=Candidatus Ligilactobacillus excrementigallinarum TaxID=2838641 RepID=A0A9D1UXU9_9LACO|nr:capsular polysaccharide synthesis protein [Candidatus Ligilactobacillus excrementigallinarum]